MLMQVLTGKGWWGCLWANCRHCALATTTAIPSPVHLFLLHSTGPNAVFNVVELVSWLLTVDAEFMEFNHW